MKNGLSGEKARCLRSQAIALLCHVLGQVILLVVRRLDRVGVLDEPRFPLRGLAGEEAVEVVEAVAGRPAVERTHRGRLVGRRVVPLAERRRLVAVVVQHLGAWWPKSSGSRRCSRPSPPRARRSCRCRRAGGCARSAAPRAWASRSTWCGRCCSEMPSSAKRLSVGVWISPPKVSA